MDFVKQVFTYFCTVYSGKHTEDYDEVVLKFNSNLQKVNT